MPRELISTLDCDGPAMVDDVDDIVALLLAMGCNELVLVMYAIGDRG